MALFKITVSRYAYLNHPLRKDWIDSDIPCTLPEHLAPYGIRFVDIETAFNGEFVIRFASEQDYILWNLYL